MEISGLTTIAMLLAFFFNASKTLGNTLTQALSAPIWKRDKYVSSSKEAENSFLLLITERCVPHLLCRVLYCIDQLQVYGCSSLCSPCCNTATSAHALSTAIMRSCSESHVSHDISYPIGSMHIPLQHTKTVQEFPDPSFRVLMMQYIQRCGNRRGSGFETTLRIGGLLQLLTLDL